MKIVIVDNYDSFTYNLVHIVEQYCEKVDVMRNDTIDWVKLEDCDTMIFSPGPGLPMEVEAMKLIMDQYHKSKPIFGVCLGMQFIGEYFGAQLINMNHIIHGIPKETLVTDPSEILFQQIPSSFQSGRYHSWLLSNKELPDCIKVTAIDKSEKLIMAIRHRKYNLCGVQFHPESIMTEHGNQMIQNWINL